MSRTRVVARLLTGLLASAAVLVGPSTAAAHDQLATSDPAAGATVTTAPERIELEFGQAPQPLGAQVVVTGPGGVPVSLGTPRVSGTEGNRSPADVYAFASDPRNLPRWARGLAGTIEPGTDGSWLADSPMGKVSVRFAERNNLGVLDHDVTLPDGTTVHNPMRVLPNAKGSEVVFSVFRRPGVDDEEFRSDTQSVERDLKALKTLLEAR